MVTSRVPVPARSRLPRRYGRARGIVRHALGVIALAGIVAPAARAAAAPAPAGTPAPADSSAAGAKPPRWDVLHADLGPVDTLRWTVTEGTWMSLDISPAGDRIAFDLLGDLYTLPITGGRATCVRAGRSYDVQPRYSPDGSWISFTSDAGGADNVWVMRPDGRDARPVTAEDFRLLNNAVWTPDGRAIVARKHFTGRRSLGSGEMWLYDVASGGGGVRLTEAPTEQKDVGEPELSPDGRYLYYSLDATPGTAFEYNKDPNAGIYEIRRLDLQTGQTVTVAGDAGGAVRPEISPDGRTLAFVRRVRLGSVLMVRDLASGRERAVYDGLSLDTQETWSVFGVYPGFAWTPDGRSIVVWAKGQLVRVDVASGQAEPIPFQADIQQEVVHALRVPQQLGGDRFPVRVVRWPRVSPDGRKVVFQALGYLWVRDLAAASGQPPARLTRGSDFEFFPAWSPDGRRIAYTTWNDVEGGRVHVVRSDGRDAHAVVEQPGHYAEPAWSPDGAWIVYRRGAGDRFRGQLFTSDPGVYVVPSAGGDPRRIARSGSRPRFDAAGQRVLLFEAGQDKKTLVSVDLLGGDRRELATSERAMELLPSPDGRWIAFEELWEVFVAPLPAAGRAVAVGPSMSNLPVRKVSHVGGEFLDWSPDGRQLRFGLGPDLYTVAVPQLFEHADPPPKAVADSLSLSWSAAADAPPTNLLLAGATVLTMDGARVIEDGAVWVRGNRIAAVGRRGEVEAPGAEVVDVTGKVLMPGLVDVHAHLGSSNLDTYARANWAYLANLSFGVTTTHDPSNDTDMVFAAHELVEAGELIGPRIFSTGTILYGAEGDFKAVIDSQDDALRHLRRLRAYGAFTVKSYNQPRRNQRQQIIAAARELQMMVVPEGGSMYGHNMTMVLDGHTTIEHAVPIAPLYADALTLMARSRTGYTPTLIVGYGGLWGENYWYQHTNVWEDARLLQWVPRPIVDARSRRRTMAPEGEFHHIELARSAAQVQHQGGNVELGAHGQMQGIGAHWELWMLGQGGLTPMEALAAATINGARALGLDADLGSVSAGKLADLVVLDADPLVDLHNSSRVALVMINGRLYDAATLEQLAPHRRSLPPRPVLDGVPPDMWGDTCVRE